MTGRLATLAGLALTAACAAPARDPGSVASFAGETVKLVIGFSQGGPYDVHGRLLAAHLGKYLPGSPSVVVENMQGAGGALAARHIATVARRDGLTIGLLTETNIVDAVDSRLLERLTLLGSPSAATQLIVFTARSGIASVDDWRRTVRPPRFASTGPRSPLFVAPMVATGALGLPVRMVTGYGNSAEARLALDTGEIDALCLTVDAFHTLFPSPEALRVVLRFSTTAVPGMDVPDAMTLTADAHARALLQTGVYDVAPFTRYYAAPPGVPAERIAALRRAMLQAWADPALRAAATAAGLMVDPVPGEALEAMLRTAAARPEILDELRTLLAAR